MSGFIVSQECMNNIVSGLFWDHELKDFYSELFEEMGLARSEDFEALAEKFYLINQAALMQRYPNDKSDYIQVPKFVWNDKPVSRMQLLKSLRCLRYQCSEGNVLKEKMFKWLEKVIDAVQDLIITSLPEWEKAKWD